jgi:hypothetical protein
MVVEAKVALVRTRSTLNIRPLDAGISIRQGIVSWARDVTSHMGITS